MKLLNSLLFISSVSTQCPAVSTMDWWTEGHEKISCTNGKNIGSRCKLQCNDPKWKTPSNGGRSDHSCTLLTTMSAQITTTAPPVECPKTSEQVKPRGAKIVSTVTQGGVAIGLELKLRFDTKYTTNDCENFTFAIKSTVPFPEDTTFKTGIHVIIIFVKLKNISYIP